MTEPGSRTTTYAYDKMSRRILVDQPNTAIEGGTASNQTRTSYYPTGTVKAVWGDQTNATFLLYDEENRKTDLRTYRSLAHGTEPTSGTSGYDVTTWAYHTQRGWLTNKEYPDGQDSGTARDPGPAYTYTAAGRLKTRTWGGGKHTRYDYRQGLLVAKRHFLTAGADTGANAGNDALTPDVGQSYNNRGQLVNVITSYTSAHPGTRVLYTYDSANFRNTRELQQVDPDITFTLAATDFAISIPIGSVPATISRYLHRKVGDYLRDTGPDLRETGSNTSTLYIGSTLAYGSADGRLLSVAGDFVGSTGTYTYAYQGNSDLIDTVTGPVHTVDNQWLSDRDALDWKQNKVGSATVSKYEYSVNAIGQRDSVAATSTVVTFATAPDWNWLYNPRGELVSSQHVNTSSSSRHYTFDAMGNRSEHRDGTHTTSGGTAKSYTPNALNQYDAVGSLSPAFDLDGNMTSGPLPAVPAANSALVWDGENQLIQVTPSGGTAIKFHYDGLGRRFASTEGTERTYWFYDGWNLVAEFTGAIHTTGTAPAVTLRRTWLWGTDLSGSLQGAGGVGGLLAANRETGPNTGVYHPLYDGNGNVGQYIDASGTAVAKYEYDGFGNSIVSTGALANTFPHRFSTKPLDAETKLYYYAYRYYDPLTGRWTNRDPIGERGGLNLYGFIRNNGIDKWDVWGLLGFGDLHVMESDRCCPEGQKKVTDEAEEECCDKEIKNVELQVDTGGVGHAQIQLPDDGSDAWGFFPFATFSASWVHLDKMTEIIPGVVGHRPHVFNSARTRTIKACPKTLEKLRASLSAHAGDTLWSASNIGANNCAGWAVARLKDAGIKNLESPDQWFLDPKQLNLPPVEVYSGYY